MKVDHFVVLKETRKDEGRVALTPHTVSSLMDKNIPIMIESEAGLLAGFTDEKYSDAGAKVFTLHSSLPKNSFILRVKRPTPEREILENKCFSSGTIMMGFLDPLKNDLTHLNRWKTLGLTLISLELLPLTADDPKNAQAAMSHFAGKLALQDALHHYQGSNPKKIAIIGTGPAGMGAALAARELQLPVTLFGRREHFQEIAKKENITYHILPEKNPHDFLRQHLYDKTIVITAARSIGKKAPFLIDERELNVLPDYAVVVDLSTGEGGSVIGSKSDQAVFFDRHISIINVSGYPKADPRAASIAFANCMVNLLFEIITPDKKLDLSNPLFSNMNLQNK